MDIEPCIVCTYMNYWDWHNIDIEPCIVCTYMNYWDWHSIDIEPCSLLLCTCDLLGLAYVALRTTTLE